MDALEIRARELLADSADRAGFGKSAIYIRNGRPLLPDDQIALNAIIAALTPPEGFVLVPVEPSVNMRGAFKWTFPQPTHAALSFGDFDVRYAAMLAARPDALPSPPEGVE